MADDAFLMREAVGHVMEHSGDLEIVARCADGDALLEAVERERPDVVITDLQMPPSGDKEGIRIADRLRATHPEIGVVVLSQDVDPRYGLELAGNGAVGRAYLLKDRVHDAGEFRAAIEVVARGGSMIDPAVLGPLLERQARSQASRLADLTRREQEVLAAMAAGMSNAAIAAHLVLSKRAVEKYVSAIFAKLALPDEHEVSRRVAAVLLYLDDARAHVEPPITRPG